MWKGFGNYMSSHDKQFHNMEEELNQINGLMATLQQILLHGQAHNCVANALEEQLQKLQKDFYEHWALLSKRNNLD